MALPEDAVQLAAIDELSRGERVNPDHYVTFCEAGGRSFALVWSHGGEIAGFLACSWVLDEATLHYVAVRPLSQKCGLGRTLMSAAMTDLKNRGINRCLLEVRESNLAAQALYHSAGFDLDGRRADYYPAKRGREDALLMSLRL